MGTIMVSKDERTADILYPSTLGKSEDSFYLGYLRGRSSSSVIVWDNLPAYYMRLYHGFNTWNSTSPFGRGQEITPGVWLHHPKATAGRHHAGD